MSDSNPLLNNVSVQGAAKSIEGLMDSKGVIKKPQAEATPVEPKEEVEAKVETETEVEQPTETQPEQQVQEVAEEEASEDAVCECRIGCGRRFLLSRMGARPDQFARRVASQSIPLGSRPPSPPRQPSCGALE